MVADGHAVRGLTTVVAALLVVAGCSMGPGAAGSVIEVQNVTGYPVHVTWPIGAPTGAESGAFDVPADSTASYAFDGTIDVAFIGGGRTLEKTVTSAIPGTLVRVRVDTSTVEIISVATPTP